MNANEQKERTTLGVQLRAEMRRLTADVELVVARYQADAKKVVENALTETNKAKAEFKKQFDEYLGEVETMLKMRGIVQAKQISDATEPLRRPFWGRIKWAVRGR